MNKIHKAQTKNSQKLIDHKSKPLKILKNSKTLNKI